MSKARTWSGHHRDREPRAEASALVRAMRLTTSVGVRRGLNPMEFRRPVALNNDAKQAQRHRRSHTALVPTQNCTIDASVSEPYKLSFFEIRRREHYIATQARPGWCEGISNNGEGIRTLASYIFCPQITLSCDAKARYCRERGAYLRITDRASLGRW
jgi:hypothetical protein